MDNNIFLYMFFAFVVLAGLCVLCTIVYGFRFFQSFNNFLKLLEKENLKDIDFGYDLYGPDFKKKINFIKSEKVLLSDDLMYYRSVCKVQWGIVIKLRNASVVLIVAWLVCTEVISFFSKSYF
jgi:hypothetical protein